MAFQDFQGSPLQVFLRLGRCPRCFPRCLPASSFSWKSRMRISRISRISISQMGHSGTILRFQLFSYVFMLHGISLESQVESLTRPHANSRVNSGKDGDHTLCTGTGGTSGTGGTGGTGHTVHSLSFSPKSVKNPRTVWTVTADIPSVLPSSQSSLRSSSRYLASFMLRVLRISYGFTIENVSHVYQYTHLGQTKHRNHLGQTCADSFRQFHFVHLTRTLLSEATLHDSCMTL